MREVTVSSARPEPERFWSKVNFDGSVPAHAPHLGPCWLWLGATSNGYGQFRTEGPSVKAYRYAYEFCVGPIPEGLTIDHLCRVRHCVCPDHLEPVTHRVNCLRGQSPIAANARKTQCLQGHPYDAENTYITPAGARDCRLCKRDALRRSRQRKKRRASRLGHMSSPRARATARTTSTGSAATPCATAPASCDTTTAATSRRF